MIITENYKEDIKPFTKEELEQIYKEAGIDGIIYDEETDTWYKPLNLEEINNRPSCFDSINRMLEDPEQRKELDRLAEMVWGDETNEQEIPQTETPKVRTITPKL